MLYIYELKLGTNALEYFANQSSKFDFHASMYVLPNKFLTTEIKKSHNIQSGSMDLLVNEIIKLTKIENKKPISSFMRELIAEKIISDLQANKQLVYFADTKVNNSLVKNICLLISDLSNRQIACENFTDLVQFNSLNADNIKNVDKLYDLAKIYTLYNRYLLALNELDIFDRYKLAKIILEDIDLEDIPWRAIYISDYYSLTELELDIIKNLSRHIDVHIALNYEKGRDEIFAALQHLRDTLLGFPTASIAPFPIEDQPLIADDLSFLCANFYNTQAVAYNTQPENIIINGFHDKNQEILYIVNSIKSKILNGAKPEDFLLVGRDLQAYPNLSDYFVRAGLPSSLPQIVYMSKHFISRLVIDILGLAFLPFSKNSLQKVMFSPPVVKYLSFDKDKLEKIFFEYDFDNISQLESLLVNIQEQHRMELKSEQIAVQKLVLLLARIPRKASTDKYIQIIKDVLQELQVLTSIGSAHKAATMNACQLKAALEVYSALTSVMDNMKNSLAILYGQDHELSGRSFNRYISKALIDKTITILDGNQNTIKVLQAADIQSTKAKHIYLFGLNDGVFPKYRLENWLLNSSEMYSLQIISTGEPELAASEDAFFFASALAMAERSITMTYLDNERVRKSKYLTEIKRIIPNMHEYTYRNMLPNKLSEIYDEQSLSDFLAFQLNRSSLDIVPTMIKQWLQHRWSAEPMQLLTIPDNQVIKTNCNTTDTLFSITQLEDYAECPFRYILNYIWKPKGWRLAALDNTTLTKGSFLHKVVEQFAQKYIKQQLPEQVLAIAELRDIFETAFSTNHTDNDYTWHLSKDKLWQILLNWLACEYQARGEYTFYATEWEFGAHKEFQVADMYIRGKIDRIDQAPTSIRITDYKYKNLISFKNFEENRTNLQIPLYMLAVNNFIDNSAQKQMQGNYYSFIKAQVGNYLSTENPNCSIEEINEQTSAILKELGAGLNSGDFMPKINKNCEYCEYTTACRALKQPASEEDESD